MSRDRELVRRHGRIGVPQTVGEPVQQLFIIFRGVGFPDVHRDVHVVDGPQRGAFGDAAGMKHLHQREIRIIGDFLRQAIPQAVDLFPVLSHLFGWQVNDLVPELD